MGLSEPAGRGLDVRWLWRRPEVGLLAVLIMVVLGFTADEPSFFSTDVLRSVLRAAAVTGVIVIAQSVLLVMKELDLSVGSVVSLSAVTSCQLVVQHHLPWILAPVLSVLVGLAVGAVNAFLIVGVGMPALIVTLGTLYGAAGLAAVVSGGLQVSGLPAGLTKLAARSLFGLPLAVYLMFLGVIVVGLVMSRTVFGASAYAIGGNANAAVRAGVTVRRYKTYAFLLSGGLAGLAGIFLSARVGLADPTQGSGLELSVITAAVVGGVSLFGGSGTTLGAFLGVLFILTVNAGLVQTGVNSSLQPVVTGVLLIVAVGLDSLRRRYVRT
jgi:ribose/xylose/arabinose/galactoside ABC-type transport system permease subunit